MAIHLLARLAACDSDDVDSGDGALQMVRYRDRSAEEMSKTLSEKQIVAFLVDRIAGPSSSQPEYEAKTELAEASLRELKAQAIEGIYERMHREAVHLGNVLVEQERSLNDLFTDDRLVSLGDLEALLAEIGRIRAELRYAHLRAHVETRARLDAEQVRTYDRLRGYGGR